MERREVPQARIGPTRLLLFGGKHSALSALAELLSLEGYLIETASHLEDLQAKVVLFSPHALLLDIDGPVRMGGIETPRADRPRFTPPEHTPLIGMSTNVEEADAHMMDVISKPIDVAKLLRLIEHVRMRHGSSERQWVQSLCLP